MEKDIESILASAEELTHICDRLAEEITEDYRNGEHPLVFVTVLKGSIFFATDLIRRVPLKCELDFMKLSSYGSSSESSGFIQVHLDLRRDVKDCDVIVIEDIIDSGRTLQKLKQLLSDRGAHSVRTCTLFDKPERRVVDLCADYVGMNIPDAFIVGYGLDYSEQYRNLPYVGILKPSVYQK